MVNLALSMLCVSVLTIVVSIVIFGYKKRKDKAEEKKLYGESKPTNIQ